MTTYKNIMSTELLQKNTFYDLGLVHEHTSGKTNLKSKIRVDLYFYLQVCNVSKKNISSIVVKMLQKMR